MKTANGVRDLKNVNCILRKTQKVWYKDGKIQKIQGLYAPKAAAKGKEHCVP